MITLYLRWIREGKMTADAVPARWREAVIALMEAQHDPA